ncbi:MAG: hypothetical protein V4719_20910 [Planctomycetota bacterium]
MTDQPPFTSHVNPKHLGIARLGTDQEQQIKTFVARVIRRARLWRSERNEVHMELLSHFDDGADAGRSAEQLIADFGPPQVAARLIRQAKLRNRSWKWQLWHRTTQVFAASVGIVICGFLFLVARLHLAKHGPRTDLVSTFDQATASIAVNDRAWPLYREGLTLLNRKSIDPNSVDFGLVFRTPNLKDPADPNWKRAADYLKANAKSIDLFIQAATLPRLGYIYRDPANDVWLKKRRGSSATETYPLYQPTSGILLPQYQELGCVRDLLFMSALFALKNKDLPRFRQLWQAESHLATQVLASAEFTVVHAIGNSIAGSALSLIRHLVVEHPELLTNEQLQGWRHDLTAANWESKSSAVDEFRRMSDDTLQNIYTAEDQGGRLTAQGARFLLQSLLLSWSFEPSPCAAILEEKQAAGLPQEYTNELQYPNSLHEAFQRELAAVRWSATLANRRELRLEAEKLLTLIEEELAKPLAQRTPVTESSYFQELQRIETTPEVFRRYWPILMMFPQTIADWSGSISEPHRMYLEATQASLALEQYRRRTGHWPERLEQLVPVDLPRVPLDAYSGQPLIYRLVEGRPLLYSVGPDRDDDGGKPLSELSWPVIPDGDEQILPPL